VTPNGRNEGGAPRATTEIGVLASKSIESLTKASRACLLYDFENAAVEDFLKELDFRLEKVLVHGALDLEVRPFELLRNGEVVYAEHDREKSLAFRLYRDGIRNLVIDPEVAWEEIVQLVGILSIRYSGIRQQEEDIVTLFRKSDFECIHVRTVTSYAAIDDELIAADGATATVFRRLPSQLLEGLADFDHPPPQVSEDGEVAYRPIPGKRLEQLHHECRPEAVPDLCLRLVERLMAAITTAADPVEVDPCIPLLRDVRDFLLSEGFAEPLHDVVRFVHQAAKDLPNAHDRQTVIEVFADNEAFAAMVDASIADGKTSPMLIEIAAEASKDRFGDLVNVLASRWSGTGCTVGRDIVVSGFGPRIPELGDLILKTHGPIASILLEAAADSDPEFAIHLALAMLRREDRGGQLKALEILDRLPYRSEIGRVVTRHSLQSSDSEICHRAAKLLVAKGERRAAPVLSRIIGERVSTNTDPERLQDLVGCLARLDTPGAIQLIESWIEPQKRSKVRSASGPRWIAAIDALTAVPGQQATELLQWIHSRASDELKVRCLGAMEKRRGSRADG